MATLRPHRSRPGDLRAPPEATPVALLRQATSAARINDARVLTAASGREKSIHQWKELRLTRGTDPSVPKVGSEPATPS